MERINEFFSKASTLKIFIIGWFLTGCLTMVIWSILSQMLEPDSGLVITFPKIFQIGVMSGIPFGYMFTVMVTTTKKSAKFWGYAEYVETLVNEANTIEQLNNILTGEYQELKNISQGGIQQTNELIRIHTIMNTKIKYLN